MAEVARRVYGSVPEEGSVREQTFQKRELVVTIDLIKSYLNENHVVQWLSG